MFRLSRALFVAMVSVLVFSVALRWGPGAVTRAAPGGRGRTRQMAHSSCWNNISFFTLRTRIGLTDYFVHHSLFVCHALVFCCGRIRG